MQCRACFVWITEGLPYCATHLKEQYGVEIRPSQIPHAGQGLFTTRAFAAFHAICPYYGIIETYAEDVKPNFDYVLELDTKHYVNGFPCRTGKGVGAMANTCVSARSGKPLRSGCNAFYKKYSNASMPWIVSNRYLPVNTEILVYYGKDYVMPQT